MSSEYEQELRRFVAETYPLAGDAERLDREESLLDAGVIDSTGVLELIGFLESRFGFEIPDEDLLPENFDSISNISAYLGRRLGG